MLVPIVSLCDHRSALSDLFPPAFVNSQMVQAVNVGTLKPVVPVQSLPMPGLSFLANRLSLEESRGLQDPPEHKESGAKIPL